MSEVAGGDRTAGSLMSFSRTYRERRVVGTFEIIAASTASHFGGFTAEVTVSDGDGRVVFVSRLLAGGFVFKTSKSALSHGFDIGHSWLRCYTAESTTALRPIRRPSGSYGH